MNGSLLRKSGLFAGLLLSFFIANAQGGIKLKLQLMPDGERWGVYAKPDESINPSWNTITTYGQVTLVMPLNYEWHSLVSVRGTWNYYFPLDGVPELPNNRIQIFHLTNEIPNIHYQNGLETLLFTFKTGTDCPESIYLWEEIPLFGCPADCWHTWVTPLNQIEVFDFENGNIYWQSSNYAPYAWDCHDTDEDGHLNAHEDTNGNGIFDQGVDVSNLNENESSYFGDLLYKLKLMPDGESWGAYVKPAPGVFPNTNQTIVGTGQVTVVMPKEYTVNSVTSVNGTWASDAVVIGPTENPTKRYQSFGLITETNPIPFQAGVETLLFTFKGNGSCPDDIYLIETQSDPFNDLPNSEGSNPSNEITVFDMVSLDVYVYGGNYAHHAADCHDNDSDGFLNALEDSNGNGVFDPEDSSDLNAVDCVISVIDQPDPVVACSGESAVFTASVENRGTPGGTIFKWEVSFDGGVAWFDLTNNPLYEITQSATLPYESTTLSIQNVAGYYGLMFRAAYGSSVCPFEYTNSVQLTVEGPITITDQPDDVGYCPGWPVSISALADVGPFGTPVYQWQVSSDNGATWEDINAISPGGLYANFNTTTLNIINPTGNIPYCYRMAVSTGECARVFTDRACMNLVGPISFTDHPDDIIQCSNEAVLFCATVQELTQGTNSSTQVHYNWEESTDGGATWNPLVNDTLHNGVETNCLSVALISSMDDGNMFRVKAWKGFCDTIASNPAILELEGPMTVVDEPDDVSECDGSGATFQATISLVNGDPNTLMYQWEVSRWIPTNPLVPAGAGAFGPWENVPNMAPYSGQTTTTLAISDVAGLYYYRYRMRYRTPICDAQWTNYAQMNLQGPIAVTNHPDHRVVCSGDATNFSIQSQNPGQGNITYQWQVCMSGDSLAGPWDNLPNNVTYNGSSTPVLSIANVAGKNGYYYRCLIRTSECNEVASYAGVLTVEGPLNITQNPEAIIDCSGNSAIINASAAIHPINSGIISYQWQYSSSATNYVDITAAGNHGFSGWDSNTLNIADVSGLEGYYFRLAARTGSCYFVYSYPAIIALQNQLTITSHPEDFTNCADFEAFFASNSNNGSPYNPYNHRQWQMSADNGATWQDITQLTYTINNLIINFAGYDNDSLLISPIYGLDGYLFRNNYWTTNCNLVTTNAARLTVEGPLTFTDQPEDVAACAGEMVQYTVAVTNETGNAPIQYQWQRWTVGGWFDLSNTAPYSGTTTNQLTITPPYSNSGNLKFRCRVKAGNCEWLGSDQANLFSMAPITISSQPVQNLTNCVTQNTELSVQASSINSLFYEWQYSEDGIIWADLSDNSLIGGTEFDNTNESSLEISNLTPEVDGYRFRVSVSNGCSTVNSNAATVNVEGPIEVTTQPLDITANAGEEAYFTANFINHGGSYPLDQNLTITNYRWQVSHDGGATWSNIVGDGNHVGISGTNTNQFNGGDTLYILNVAGLSGYMYRIGYSTPTCSEPVYSNPAALTVDGNTNLSIESQSADVTACAGSQACFSISVAAPAATQVEYLWQKLATTGWVNLSNTAGTDLLCLIAESSTKYRCGARANGGNWVFSNDFNLQVEGPISIDPMPGQLDICSNRGAALNATVQNPGAGQVSLRWQYSKDGGLTWLNLPTNNGNLTALGAPYPVQPDAQWHGALSNSLTFTNSDGLNGWMFRLTATTPLCEATSDATTLHVLDACQEETCDYDNDGVLNEVDGDYNVCGSVCLKVKLQLLPDSSGWAVMAKPFGGWDPSVGILTQTGRISIVAPSDFAFQGINSVGGNWLATNVTENIPGHPGRKCMTFELSGQQEVHIPYKIGEATTLFTFDKAGPCPEALYILEEAMPGIEANMLSGIDNGFAGGFDLCGVYARKAWRCQQPGGTTPGGPIIIVTADDLGKGAPKEVVDRNESQFQTGTNQFTAYPNPASEYVDIAISPELAEGQPTLSLFDLQGRKRLDVQLDAVATRLDLSNLPAGVYFVSLAQNGRMLYREKLIKH